jgi:hypothetical protein
LKGRQMAGSGDWQTPLDLVDMIKSYQRITLDPCTSKINPTRALRYFTSLAIDPGRNWGISDGDFVFMNPPFSRGVTIRFVRKLLEQLPPKAEALVLLRQDNTQAIDELMAASKGVLIPHQRIHYYDPATGDQAKGVNFGSWLFQINGDPIRFAHHFCAENDLGFYFRKW